MSDCPVALCGVCGVNTWPWEQYMVTDAVWAAAGAPDGFLCVGCLEDRLDRRLNPDDFPPLPLNDDEPTDSVRLRTRKGSGRAVGRLYDIAALAVLDAGADLDVAATVLGLDARLLAQCVTSIRINREVMGDGR